MCSGSVSTGCELYTLVLVGVYDCLGFKPLDQLLSCNSKQEDKIRIDLNPFSSVLWWGW